MPTPTYPFPDIATLREYITDVFTANGTREITGPDAWDALTGIVDLISPTLQVQLVAQLGSGSVGGVTTGTTFTAGATLESVLRAILIQAIHPTYAAPTAVENTDTPTLNQEVGSLISATLSYIFTQNNAGAQTGVTLFKNGTQISTAMPYMDASVTLGDSAPVAYQASIAYAQGACINNNLGTPDCTGRIIAGAVNTNTITYNGYRKVFWGVPVAPPASSSDVRGNLSSSALNPANGTQFTIHIPAGSLNVAFAYPATLEDVASVLYVEASNQQVKGNFTSTIISVQGANSYTAINYKVWVFTPVEAFTEAATYLVTI